MKGRLPVIQTVTYSHSLAEDFFLPTVKYLSLLRYSSRVVYTGRSLEFHYKFV
jgi:hypothetical protein